VEEKYKQLTRDYENAQKSYQDLLGKKSTADLTVQMNTQAQGERMFVLNLAALPDAPSFPNRLLFAAGGLGAGLAIGLGLVLWLEIRDNSIRTERDAEAVLELPTLIAIPWIGAAEPTQNGRFKFWHRNKAAEDRDAVIGT
jgi:capsular polysaccharide biosynthesis protein